MSQEWRPISSPCARKSDREAGLAVRSTWFQDLIIQVEHPTHRTGCLCSALLHVWGPKCERVSGHLKPRRGLEGTIWRSGGLMGGPVAARRHPRNHLGDPLGVICQLWWVFGWLWGAFWVTSGIPGRLFGSPLGPLGQIGGLSGQFWSSLWHSMHGTPDGGRCQRSKPSVSTCFRRLRGGRSVVFMGRNP